jgi:hypothetical protein
MRILAAAVLGAASLLSACSDSANYYGEEWSGYYRRPAEETQGPAVVERREIVAWANDPRKKRRLGYLEKKQMQVQGSRDTRSCWYIRDPRGLQDIGFITHEGRFYRFDRDGRLGEYVGPYSYFPTGLKVFFGIPIGDNLDLEEIDPYK